MLRGSYHVNAQGGMKISAKTFRSKLSRELVQSFRNGSQTVDGEQLLGKLQATLDQYIHLEDHRFYLFESLWLMGTYLYSIFGNYGYLFLWSAEMRSGKSRNLEVFSHLAFEASKPVNAPTPPSIRELAAEGGTLQLDTLERWRDKSHEAFSAAMTNTALRPSPQVNHNVSSSGS